MPRINHQIARRHYLTARLAGWLAAVTEAAEAFNVLPEDLLAIGSRETNLDERFLRSAGDNGHGYGITQVDRRAFPEWVRDGKWKNARECFLKTAEILRANMEWLKRQAGQITVVHDSRDNLRRFIMPHFDAAELRRVAIAMYNGGHWTASNPSKGLPVDASTTERNYSSDVLERAAWFDEFLGTDDEFLGTTRSNNEQKGMGVATGSDSLPTISPADAPANNMAQASPSPVATQPGDTEPKPAPSITPDSTPVIASMNERAITKAMAALTGGDTLAAAKEWLLGSKDHALILFGIAALLFVAWLLYNHTMNKHRINTVADLTKGSAV